MRINGDTENLGSWNKGVGPILMEKGDPREWLTGQTVRPWEHKFVSKNCFGYFKEKSKEVNPYFFFYSLIASNIIIL